MAGMAGMAVKAARMLWAWAACRPVGRPRWIVVIAATAIPLNLLFSLPHIRASSTRFEKPFLHCRTSPPQHSAPTTTRQPPPPPTHLHHHHALYPSWPLAILSPTTTAAPLFLLLLRRSALAFCAAARVPWALQLPPVLHCPSLTCSRPCGPPVLVTPHPLQPISRTTTHTTSRCLPCSLSSSPEAAPLRRTGS
jgi:hypothetical protein